MLGEKEDALLILKELEKDPIVQQDTSYLVNVLISLYSVSDKTEKDCPQRAYTLAQKLKYNPLITLSLQTMGIDAYDNNEPDSALFTSEKPSTRHSTIITSIKSYLYSKRFQRLISYSTIPIVPTTI